MEFSMLVVDLDSGLLFFSLFTGSNAHYGIVCGNGTCKEVFIRYVKNVYALNLSNGDEVWTTAIPEKLNVSIGPVLLDGTVFVASNNKIFALNKTNGNLLYNKTFEKIDNILFNKYLFVIYDKGNTTNIHCIDPNKHIILWNKTFKKIQDIHFSENLFILSNKTIYEINESNGNIIKAFYLNISIKNFDVKGERIFVSSDNKLYVINTKNNLTWKFSLNENEKFVHKFEISNNGILIESESKDMLNLYLINMTNGLVIDKFSTEKKEGKWQTKPIAQNNKVFINLGDKICALGNADTIIRNLSYSNKSNNYTISFVIVNYGDEKEVNAALFIRGDTPKIKSKVVHLDKNSIKEINFSVILNPIYITQYYDLIVVSIPNSLQYANIHIGGKKEPVISISNTASSGLGIGASEPEQSECTMPKDILDAVKMLEYLSGQKNSTEYCDLNNDEKIDLNDVLNLVSDIVIRG